MMGQQIKKHSYQTQFLCWEHYVKYSSVISEGNDHETVAKVKHFNILVAALKWPYRQVCNSDSVALRLRMSFLLTDRRYSDVYEALCLLQILEQNSALLIPMVTRTHKICPYQKPYNTGKGLCFISTVVIYFLHRTG
jgi:hypothetical protein